MKFQEAVQQQRVKYIISSYRLGEVNSQEFDNYLEMLMAHYPLPLIELALVETLIQNWLQVPMKRGDEFLAQAHEQLQIWERHALIQAGTAPCAIASTITREQFQQITNLDPSPIFGMTDIPQAGDRAASV
ncbi:hypothetical protein [Leptodesmis sichuanensis]|uniref:hypothetical protein n=1 Tax=Leptodesmis sichuanensis TaxID=2906798 RepID=UPI001F37071D|nr:hypothetical protein [Leptodesmis sichuanensis]UIE38806.1 hypothetical protein KIK02_04085 [Leptodesmis sichuanensis A121]